MRTLIRYRNRGTGLIWLLAGIWSGLAGQESPEGELVVGFEELTTQVPPLIEYTGPGGGEYYNGSDGNGGFTSEGIRFLNDYNADWASWIGWAYSTTTDTETPGYGNQYSSYAGAAGEGEVYAVTYAPSSLFLPVGKRAPVSLLVSNTSYGGLSMRDGDDFARKFGDDPSTADQVESDYPDTFKLRIEGWTDTQLLGAVEIYLADFRGTADTDYILADWLEVDLSPLSGWTEGGVAEMRFLLESTDTGAFGMNTPAYIAIDQLVLRSSPSWGPYDLSIGNHINTGAFLGWVYPQGDYVYVYALGKWNYLPETQLENGTGVWMYVPRQDQ